MTTSDQSALLAAILTDPSQDTPRLAYADWCEENGQPERAEFIRVQVRPEFLARLFSEWPVTEAGLVGKRPWGDGSWWGGENYGDDEDLPFAVWDKLELPTDPDVPNWKDAHTAEAANTALSDAIVSLGRAAAGLPQIGEG